MDKVAIALIKSDLKSLKKMLEKALSTGKPQMGLDAETLKVRISEIEALISWKQ